MAGLAELMREYERKRYPADRQLDLQGESPSSARDRALHWIQSRAHETPGDELLIIVQRGVRPGRPPNAIEAEVRKLLDSMVGRLIGWWQPFAPGSLALRLADEPRFRSMSTPRPQPEGDGRTAETAGTARPEVENDIPGELYPAVGAVADLRMEREQLSPRVRSVLLREIWIEAQAVAMEKRLDFSDALERLRAREVELAYDD